MISSCASLAKPLTIVNPNFRDVPRVKDLPYKPSRSLPLTRRPPTANLRTTLSLISSRSPIFSPDNNRLLAPPGELAAVPNNDVLKFVLIQRKTGSFSTPWSIPSWGDFDNLVNEATQVALTNDCLTPFAWADPKRGNIALYATSRIAIEQFREVIRSISVSYTHLTLPTIYSV